LPLGLAEMGCSAQVDKLSTEASWVPAGQYSPAGRVCRKVCRKVAGNGSSSSSSSSSSSETKSVSRQVSTAVLHVERIKRHGCLQRTADPKLQGRTHANCIQRHHTKLWCTASHVQHAHNHSMEHACTQHAQSQLCSTCPPPTPLKAHAREEHMLSLQLPYACELHANSNPTQQLLMQCASAVYCC
jgi:hypothetical protein